MKVIYQANSYVVFHNTPFQKKKQFTRFTAHVKCIFLCKLRIFTLLHFPAPLEDKSVVKLVNLSLPYDVCLVDSNGT